MSGQTVNGQRNQRDAENGLYPQMPSERSQAVQKPTPSRPPPRRQDTIDMEVIPLNRSQSAPTGVETDDRRRARRIFDNVSCVCEIIT